MYNLFVLFIIVILCENSCGRQQSNYNTFIDGAEDYSKNNDESSKSRSNDEFPKKFAQKSAKDNDEADLADLEVILNSGPMIAPDIIIRHFVDPKMTIDKMMEEMLSNEKKKKYSLEDEDDSDADDSDMPLHDHSYARENEIGDETDDMMESFMNKDNHNQQDEVVHDHPSYTKALSTDLKIFTGNQPCRMKLNGSSGHFSLNFTQDCLILLTTPEKKSTVVLNCSPIKLGNCSINRDTLTVNLKGDLRFGRNSYIYCGSNVQIRATSLQRRISIKVRKDEAHKDQVTSCSFHTRKRRDLSFSTRDDDGKSQSDTCGRLGRMSKIVGGRRVSPGLFPWAAQLDITRTDGTQTACTGSLISSKYILSAAHCLKNAESISVFMGGTDRHEFTGSEIIVQAEKYILHRKWSPSKLSADIALVKLTDNIKFSEDVRPICLPTGKLLHETFNGRKGVAVGWGRVESKKKAPRQLYRVRLPFLDEPSCKRHYRRFFNPKMMVCTDSSTNSAICYGDSGGPLMYKRKERVYQIGVASFSLSKICGASPDVFTLVSQYTPWIESRIQKANDDE